MSPLEHVAYLKEQSGSALANALEGLRGTRFSEKDLAAAWLSKLRETGLFYEEGWYAPPPDGVIALFGKARDGFKRINEPSFRPEHVWPRPDLFHEPGDMIAAYASPVHKETSLIGDFGLTLYTGTDPEILTHCETVLNACLHIAGYAQVGMTLSEICNYGLAYGQSLGLRSIIVSQTDITGAENIGHTIPLSFAGDLTRDAVHSTETFEDLRNALSKGRVFVSTIETQRVEPDMAFTIEPRFSTDRMPQTWFHLTVIFERGQKRVCHGFEPVFKAENLCSLLKTLR